MKVLRAEVMVTDFKMPATLCAEYYHIDTPEKEMHEDLKERYKGCLMYYCILKEIEIGQEHKKFYIRKLENGKMIWYRII